MHSGVHQVTGRLGKRPDVFENDTVAAECTTVLKYAVASSVLPKLSTFRAVEHKCVKSCQSALSILQRGRRVRGSPSAEVKTIGKWSLPCKSGKPFQLKSKSTADEQRDNYLAVNNPV